MSGGKHAKQAAKAARWNVRAGVEPPRRAPPPPEVCDPVLPAVHYPLSGDTRIMQHTVRRDNRVVDYSVQHEGLVDEWEPVMRIDCRHSEVHAHRFFPQPERREIIRGDLLPD